MEGTVFHLSGDKFPIASQSIAASVLDGCVAALCPIVGSEVQMLALSIEMCTAVVSRFPRCLLLKHTVVVSRVSLNADCVDPS